MICVANWKMNGNEALAQEYKMHFSNVITCPPFTLLNRFESEYLGAQNCSMYDDGAHTGEVSVRMLKEVGCSYVIVGHSERQEVWSMVLQKAARIIEHAMIPIICVTEYRQIDLDPTSYFVAYEPIGAIGTGKTPTPDQILGVTQQLKQRCNTVFYGGSVNSQNAYSFKEVCDGLLIGGASLKIDEMQKIIAAVA